MNKHADKYTAFKKTTLIGGVFVNAKIKQRVYEL